MTSTAATSISHDQQPGRSDMDEHQRDEYLRTACRAADQEWRAVNEAANRPSPEDLDAAYQRARDAALAALTGAGLDGDEAVALAERAARQQDDESEVPAEYTEHHASRYRYPARVGKPAPPRSGPAHRPQPARALPAARRRPRLPRRLRRPRPPGPPRRLTPSPGTNREVIHQARN